jgi:hypothetical protein
VAIEGGVVGTDLDRVVAFHVLAMQRSAAWRR